MRTMCHLPTPAIVLSLLAGAAHAGTPPVIYVNAAAPAGGDGTSWATAYRDLHVALDLARSPQEIWIAQGTYVPTRHWGYEAPYPRAYAVAGGVRLFGGFQGTEASHNQADPLAHPTILSGDINADDGPNFTNRTDNTPTVLRILESVTNAPTELNGLVIFGSWIHTSTNSNTRGAPLVIANCRFDGNNASPAINSRELTMTDTVFTNIRESWNEGYRYFQIGGGGVARVERCLFDNVGPGFGGVSAVVDCEFRDCGLAVGSSSAVIDSRWHDTPERVIGVGASVSGALIDTTVSDESALIFLHVYGGLISGGNFHSTRLVQLYEIPDLDPPVFHDCRFSGEYEHRMFTTYDGGSATFQHCDFTDIRATTASPRAMYLQKGAFLFEDCLFARIEDELIQYYPDTLNPPAFTFRRCRFIDNVNASLSISGTPVVLEDSIFVGNRVDSGTMISSWGGGLAMNNCTFAFNHLQWGLPVVDVGFDDETTMLEAHNCIFRNNAPLGTHIEVSPLPRIDSPLVSVTNCLGNSLETQYPNAGNINTDPMFLDPLGPDQLPATGDEDVRLAPGSPCIDAGRNDIDTNPFADGIQPIGAADAELNTRTWSVDPSAEQMIDMGALEFAAPALRAPAHAPQLLVPRNQHPTAGTRMILVWKPVTGARTYAVQIARDELFTDVAAEVEGITRPCLDAATLNLPREQKLWWRVIAVGSVESLTSEPWSFTTSIPGPPTTAAPIASDINHDCRVDSRDLSALVTMLRLNAGPVNNYSLNYDINRDDLLNGADLSILLSQYGDVCNQ